MLLSMPPAHLANDALTITQQLLISPPSRPLECEAFSSVHRFVLFCFFVLGAFAPGRLLSLSRGLRRIQNCYQPSKPKKEKKIRDFAKGSLFLPFALPGTCVVLCRSFLRLSLGGSGCHGELLSCILPPIRRILPRLWPHARPRLRSEGIETTRNSDFLPPDFRVFCSSSFSCFELRFSSLGPILMLNISAKI